MSCHVMFLDLTGIMSMTLSQVGVSGEHKPIRSSMFLFTGIYVLLCFIIKAVR